MPIPKHRLVHQNPARPRSDDDALAGGDSGGYDGPMEARVAKLESDITAIKIDAAVIKVNGAAKSDIADLRAATKADIADLRAATRTDIADLKGATKADISEAKTTIIMWVVGAIFVAQLLPIVKDLMRPLAPHAAIAPAPAPAMPTAAPIMQ